jgi:hypothetical protein
MQRPRVVADPQRQLALEEVEALVLVEVDVQRRLAAGRGDGLDEREAAGVRGEAWMRTPLSRNWISSVMSCAPWR